MIKWVQHQKSLKVEHKSEGGGDWLPPVLIVTLEVRHLTCASKGVQEPCVLDNPVTSIHILILPSASTLPYCHVYTRLPLHLHISKRFVFYYDLYSYLSCNICIVFVPYSYCICIVFVSICIPQSFTASGPSI